MYNHKVIEVEEILLSETIKKYEKDGWEVCGLSFYPRKECFKVILKREHICDESEYQKFAHSLLTGGLSRMFTS